MVIVSAGTNEQGVAAEFVRERKDIGLSTFEMKNLNLEGDPVLTDVTVSATG